MQPCSSGPFLSLPPHFRHIIARRSRQLQCGKCECMRGGDLACAVPGGSRHMRRLVLTACIAGLAMAGHVPFAMAADDASTASDSADKAKAGKIKLAHVRSDGTKELAARSAVTKAAREVEAIEAVSSAAPPQPIDATASTPADADAVPADAPAVETRDTDRKAAEAKPKHMNTG